MCLHYVISLVFSTHHFDTGSDKLHVLSLSQVLEICVPLKNYFCKNVDLIMLVLILQNLILSDTHIKCQKNRFPLWVEILPIRY